MKVFIKNVNMEYSLCKLDEQIWEYKIKDQVTRQLPANEWNIVETIISSAFSGQPVAYKPIEVSSIT
jgi:hypothetical protein